MKKKSVPLIKQAVYDKQFKTASIKMAQTGEKIVYKTVKKFGISSISMYRLINKYGKRS